VVWAPAADKPPVTPTDDVREVIHGVGIVDPYRWLEDQTSSRTRAWISAQNAYSRPILDVIPGRDGLKKRLSELLKIDVTNVPLRRNGRCFFTRRRAGQDQFVLYMRTGIDGVDEVLIDPHSLSPDHTVSISLLDVAGDGSLLAYGVRRGGEDEVIVKLFDVEKRQDLPDALPRGRYFGVSIKPDKSGFYYTRHTAEGSRVHYHTLGRDPAADPRIFGDGCTPQKTIGAELSDDGRYLIIHVRHGSAADVTEVYIQDLAAGGPIRPIVNDVRARFLGSVGGDTLYLHTNWQAANGRVVAVDLARPAREHWREVVPEGKAVIEGFSLAGGRLLVSYLENVNSRVRVFNPDGRRLREIAFPTLGSARDFEGRWSDSEAFFSFDSFHVPTTIYRYEVAKGRQEVWSRQNVPIAAGTFELKQVWYESKDGARVPMFLLQRKGLKLDGSRPTLLTGYGGFNVSRTPRFDSRAVIWVERGGVHAVPNLRGGGEFGEAWHRAGMLEKKQNVFDDFIAAAEWLIKKGYTNPAKLAIAGGSNGGLLVGAALTQRPELFRAVLCHYPLLDMIRYHKFLVARLWVPEYGSAEDPGQFRYIYTYSPYHRVKKGLKYPAVLFVTGDADTRVAPLHARKMTALLQSATASERPVLLRYDTRAGHSRGLPIGKQIEDLADELGFVLWQLGAL